jgi:hypothetical protein
MSDREIGFLLCIFLSANFLLAQQSAKQPAATGTKEQNQVTVRGCLRGERGNYILVTDQTGLVYALQGVGHKLDRLLRKEVEVTGEAKPGTVRTGVRPERAGETPSDAARGVDGVPLQIKNVKTDIKVISKHCKAADAQ